MISERPRYSSDVKLRMFLEVDGSEIELAQLGPEHGVLKTQRKLETGYAKIQVIVDGQVSSEERIFLPHGVESDSLRFVYF